MKANPSVHPSLPASFRPAAFRLPTAARVVLLAVAAGAGLSACSEQRAIPRPTPSVSPRPAPSVLPRPSTPAAAQPGPSRPAPAPASWIDLPAAPGNWTWRPIPGGSQADFGGGQLTLRCDVVAQTVTLQRAGAVDGASTITMTISTTQTTRSVQASAAERRTGGPMVQATLAARDPLLDAMAFSRGRFAIGVPGLPLLSVPNWAEVGRVIEDCR